MSDAHKGINADFAEVLDASWQSYRVHFMRNALAHAGKSGRRVVSALIAAAFVQDDAEAARAQWRHVADQLSPKLPKLASFLDATKTDVVACTTFPTQHRIKPRSTNPIESGSTARPSGGLHRRRSPCRRAANNRCQRRRHDDVKPVIGSFFIAINIAHLRKESELRSDAAAAPARIPNRNRTVAGERGWTRCNCKNQLLAAAH